ncbi:hypothetical protein L9F63_023588, partial [Diploptera punctata]
CISKVGSSELIRLPPQIRKNQNLCKISAMWPMIFPFFLLTPNNDRPRGRGSVLV